MYGGDRMQKQTLEMYGKEITVYTISQDGIYSANGLTTELEKIPVLKEKEAIDAPRIVGSFYGVGRGLGEYKIVLAEGLDTKQLTNLFISLDVIDAEVSPCDISNVEIIELQDEKKEEEITGKLAVDEVFLIDESILAETITADHISDVSLGGPNPRITAGTIKAEDIEKPKAQPKKRSRKATPKKEQ
jgi:hypothetical protein